MPLEGVRKDRRESRVAMKRRGAEFGDSCTAQKGRDSGRDSVLLFLILRDADFVVVINDTIDSKHVSSRLNRLHRGW